jgi:hypothetical protein
MLRDLRYKKSRAARSHWILPPASLLTDNDFLLVLLSLCSGAGHVLILGTAWLVAMMAAAAGERERKSAGHGKDRLGNPSNPN